jgi:hypothetical protein
LTREITILNLIWIEYQVKLEKILTLTK